MHHVCLRTLSRATGYFDEVDPLPEGGMRVPGVVASALQDWLDHGSPPVVAGCEIAVSGGPVDAG